MSLNRLAAFASVIDAKSCSIMAVEDGLLVLAITRKVPGTVACRLSAVITTSEGGLYSLVMVLTSNHRTLAQFAITYEGLTVMSIETVASYPTAAASCCAMATRRSRWCMLPTQRARTEPLDKRIRTTYVRLFPSRS